MCSDRFPIVLRDDVQMREGPGADVGTEGVEPLAYDARVRFEVLGTLRVVAVVSTGGRSVPTQPSSLGGPKQRFVLARLLAEPNRLVSLDRLVDGLWGEEPPESARHTIQGYVFAEPMFEGEYLAWTRDSAGATNRSVA